MKTPEDEAFDDLAKKQGDWGGGFPAKRQMAADKLQENVPLYASKTAFGGWREFASDYERGFIDGMQKQAQSSVDKAVNQMAQPAQEPIYKITVFDNAHPKGIPLEDWVQPPQEPVAWGWRYDSCGHAVVNRLVATETSKPTLFLKNVFARGPFPLYAAPPQRTWVGLTDQESIDIIKHNNNYLYPIKLLQAVMDALKEKNT
jgi:hypothetical protein